MSEVLTLQAAQRGAQEDRDRLSSSLKVTHQLFKKVIMKVYDRLFPSFCSSSEKRKSGIVYLESQNISSLPG